MKKVLMVQKADGTRERLCPQCTGVMNFHDSGYADRFSAGEYYQQEFPAQWECTSCGLVIDEVAQS